MRLSDFPAHRPQRCIALRCRPIHGFARQLPSAILLRSLQGNSENCHLRMIYVHWYSRCGHAEFPSSLSLIIPGDISLCRCEEYGSCPTSSVFPSQFGGTLDQSALPRCQRNAQMIVLSVFRVFTHPYHTGSLNKKNTRRTNYRIDCSQSCAIINCWTNVRFGIQENRP